MWRNQPRPTLPLVVLQLVALLLFHWKKWGPPLQQVINNGSTPEHVEHFSLYAALPMEDNQITVPLRGVPLGVVFRFSWSSKVGLHLVKEEKNLKMRCSDTR